MSIIRWYEITCDYCKCGEHFQGNIKSAENQYKEYGGIVKISNGEHKHYCSKKCYEKGYFGSRIKSSRMGHIEKGMAFGKPRIKGEINNEEINN